MSELLENIEIYESNYRIKTGGSENGEKIKSSNDHKVCGGSRKYGKGSNKTTKIKIQSAVDSRGIMAFDVVANERKPQVHHTLQLQNHKSTFIMTDQAAVFNTVPEIEDKDYGHGNCNHSGMMDKKTARIHHFKDPVTGYHTNPVEHAHGKIQQMYGKKGQSLRNVNLFRRKIKQFTCKHNRTSNYQAQIFLLMIHINKTVKPPNASNMKLIEDVNFDDCFDVHYIFDKKGDFYRVKFKDYNWDYCEWMEKSHFIDPNFPDEYDALPKDEKEKILSKAKKLMKNHVTKCKNRACIAGLNDYCIEKLCKDKNTFNNGYKLYTDCGIIRSTIKGIIDIKRSINIIETC